jgi:hypothetical protein
MKCRALKDGLNNKTDYVRAGEVFEAKKCPSWATPVAPPKKDVKPEQKDGE